MIHIGNILNILSDKQWNKFDQSKFLIRTLTFLANLDFVMYLDYDANYRISGFTRRMMHDRKTHIA